MSVGGDAHVQCTRGDQRTTCRNHVSPSVMWASGWALWCSGWAGFFPYWAILSYLLWDVVLLKNEIEENKKNQCILCIVRCFLLYGPLLLSHAFPCVLGHVVLRPAVSKLQIQNCLVLVMNGFPGLSLLKFQFYWPGRRPELPKTTASVWASILTRLQSLCSQVTRLLCAAA